MCGAFTNSREDLPKGGARSVKKQLGLTCKANGIDQKDKTGWTGLMKAASQGDLEIVALMIGAGADVRMVCGCIRSELTDLLNCRREDAALGVDVRLARRSRHARCQGWPGSRISRRSWIQSDA